LLRTIFSGARLSGILPKEHGKIPAAYHAKKLAQHYFGTSLMTVWKRFVYSLRSCRLA